MALLICLLQRVPVVHLFNSRFKEQIGDVCGARATFLQCEAESSSNFVENVKMKANMEKRMVCSPLFYHSKGGTDFILSRCRLINYICFCVPPLSGKS
jgi:hypothetical protein